jgi:hypothetical protein
MKVKNFCARCKLPILVQLRAPNFKPLNKNLAEDSSLKKNPAQLLNDSVVTETNNMITTPNSNPVQSEFVPFQGSLCPSCFKELYL